MTTTTLATEPPPGDLWSDVLPVEMRGEVLRHGTFLTRLCLALTSRGNYARHGDTPEERTQWTASRVVRALAREWPTVAMVAAWQRAHPIILTPGLVAVEAASADNVPILEWAVATALSPAHVKQFTHRYELDMVGRALILDRPLGHDPVPRLAWLLAQCRGCLHVAQWQLPLAIWATTGAGAGRLDVLQWAWAEMPAGYLLNPDHCARLLRGAAEGGHAAVFQWLDDEPCRQSQPWCPCSQWPSYLWVDAAWGGHVSVLAWLWEHRCPVAAGGYAILTAAVSHGHVPVLDWLVARGLVRPAGADLSLDKRQDLFHAAVQYGHVEALRWLLGQFPPPVPIRVLALACGTVKTEDALALGGLLLPYCTKRPLPFGVMAAALRDHPRDPTVAAWVHAQGCHWTLAEALACLYHKDEPVEAWLRAADAARRVGEDMKQKPSSF